MEMKHGKLSIISATSCSWGKEEALQWSSVLWKEAGKRGVRRNARVAAAIKKQIINRQIE